MHLHFEANNIRNYRSLVRPKLAYIMEQVQNGTNVALVRFQ